ncbi:MAG: methyltransferase, partial [Rhodanobacter sp.]
MRPAMLALLLTLALPAAASAQVSNLHSGAITAAVQKGVDDPARQADKHDDARRKVALVMTFAEVKPGQNVLELIPGSGYWTRVFSAIVGPTGHVYTVWPDETAKFSSKSLASWKEL